MAWNQLERFVSRNDPQHLEAAATSSRVRGIAACLAVGLLEVVHLLLHEDAQVDVVLRPRHEACEKMRPRPPRKTIQASKGRERD